MKKKLLFALLSVASAASAQSLVQTVNSGGIAAPSSSVSIGEIVVIPQNPIQSTSGIIGILAQNQQTLEVPQFDVAADIVAYPNPTTAGIFFESNLKLFNEEVSVFNNAGQLVSKKQVSGNNSIELSELPAGIYLIRFADKSLNPFKIIKH